MIKKTTLISIVISCVLFISTSCTGFQYTLKGGKIPGSTFSIENFENIAPLGSPSISIWVQDLLRDRLLKETSLKYKSEDGDANFVGTIVSYRISPELGTGDNIVDLNRLTISLKVVYSNGVDEKNDFTKTFTAYDQFKSDEDISLKEEELIETIGEDLVSQIFNEVLIDW